MAGIQSLSRKKDSHKGENGTVLIAAGDQDYVGAAALAGLAALRSGSDLSIIAAPEKVAWAINCLTPDLITIKLKGTGFKKEHVKALQAWAKKADSILIGNGIGLKSKEFVAEAVKKFKDKLKVIDADALKSLDLKETYNAVITPHAREFEILLGNNGNKDLAKILKENRYDDKMLTESKKIALILENLDHFFKNNNVLLLKGVEDLIISRTKVLVNRTGNEGMSVGGTGDILAGLVAGYLSQTHDLFESACLAAHNCGKIGDMLMEDARYGKYGFIASDFLQKINNLDMEKLGINRPDTGKRDRSEPTLPKKAARRTSTKKQTSRGTKMSKAKMQKKVTKR